MKTRPLFYIFITLLLLCSAYSGVKAATDDEELLDPKIAFSPSGFASSDDTLSIKYDIAEGYFLYKHGFKFSAPDGDITIGEARIPAGKKKKDEWFGEVETYRNQVIIDLPYSWKDNKPNPVTLEVTAQGCADIGVCFPPQKQFVEIDTTKIVGVEKPTLPVAEQDRIAATLTQGASLLTLLTFFGFGLLLAFTPCVFPMIPILSGIIVGQGKSITTRKAFLLSLTYVLAMAIAYAAAGIIVVALSQNIQASMQNPWVLGVFSAIFVLLALSMFGFYDLQMPNSIQGRLTAISNSQQSGSFIGAAVMGFLSALIVGPCMAPPLFGALAYLAQTKDWLLGGAALFALGLGAGAPLIIIGTSAGKLLPKAGGWMDAVKAFFGVMLLAVAVWLLSRIIPETVTMLLYAALAIGSAVYLGALEPKKVNSSGWSSLWKAIGLLLLLYGALLIIGASIGGGTMLQPLRGLHSSASGSENTSRRTVKFELVKGVTGLEQALATAKQNNQPVMLDLFADWCVSCKEMESFTFTDGAVQSALANFMLIQSNVTDNDEDDKALLKQLGVFGPPAIVFYSTSGEEIEGGRVVGYMNAEDFEARLQQILGRI